MIDLKIVPALVISSFLFWRRLKDDHEEATIFKLTLLMLVVGILCSRLFFIIFNFSTFGFYFAEWLSLNYRANFSFSGALFGVVTAAWWWTKKKRLPPWEVLDSLAPSLYLFVLFGGVGRFWSFSVLGLLGLLFLPWLRSHFRSFSWYKSGKTGFLFCSSVILLLLPMLVLAFLKDRALYWESLSWIVLILIAFGALYSRSEREPKISFKFWDQRRKK